MPRLLLALENLNPSASATEAALLCERLLGVEDVQMRVVSIQGEGPMRARFQELGLHVEPLPRVSGIGSIPALRAWGTDLAASPTPPECLIAFDAESSLAIRIACWGVLRLPLVEYRCEASGLTGLRGALDSKVNARNRSWVIPQTRELDVVARTVPQERLVRVPVGIDAVKVFPLAAASRERMRRLLNIPEQARLVVAAQGEVPDAHWHRGVVDFSSALARQLPDAWLVLVGEGPDLRTLAGESPIRHRLRVIGGLSSLEGQVLSAADVCLEPGVGLRAQRQVYKAMAAGTPAVVGSGVLSRDAERRVRLYPPLDFDAAARAVGALLDNREAASALASDARSWVASVGEINRAVDMLIDLIDRLLGLPQRPARRDSGTGNVQRLTAPAHE